MVPLLRHEYCNICGDTEGIRHYPSKRQYLCRYCAADTPRKASRSSFEESYWGPQVDLVDQSTRREFYADYLASGDTLEEYKQATTSTIDSYYNGPPPIYEETQ